MANYFKPKKTLLNATAILAVFIALFMVSSGAVSAVTYSGDSSLTTMSETVESPLIPAYTTDVLSRQDVMKEYEHASAPLATPETMPIAGDVVFLQTFEEPWVPDYEGETSPRADAMYGDIPPVQYWEAEWNEYTINYMGLPTYWDQYLWSLTGSYAAMVPLDDDFCDDEIGQDVMIISPEICLDCDAVLSFLTEFTGIDAPADDHDYVKISTDGGCSWETLMDLSYEYPSGAYEINIDLSAYNGECIRIAFHRVMEEPWVNSIHNWYVDQVQLTCIPEHDVGVNAIIAPTGGVAGHGAGNIVDCDDLEFDVTVEVCNYGLSDETEINTTVTIFKDDGSGAPDLDYHELFDHGDTSLPTGWSNEEIGTGPVNADWETNPTYDCAEIYTVVPTGITGDDILWSPLFDCSGLSDVTLEISHYMNEYSVSLGDVIVEVGGVQTTIDTFDADTTNPQTDIYDLTALAAGNADVRVGFYYQGVYEMYWRIFEFHLTGTGSAGGWIPVYEEEILVDLPAMTCGTFELPKWTPDAWHTEEDVCHDYRVEAGTDLIYYDAVTDTWVDIDEQPGNDDMISVFSLCFPFFHDVGVMEIVEPSDGLGQCVEPEVVIYNYGQFEECCFIVDIGIDSDPLGQNTFWFESFESGLPADWEQVEYSGGYCPGYWFLEEYGDNPGPYTGEPAGTGDFFMETDSDANPYDIFDVGLFTPEIDLSAAGDEVVFSFDYWATYAWYGYEDFLVYMWDDGVPSEIFDAYWELTEGTFTYTIDVTALVDPTTIQFEFYYTTNGLSYMYGVSIDDVMIGVPADNFDTYEDSVCIAGEICVGEEQTVTFEEFCPDELNWPETEYDVLYNIVAATHLCYPADEDPSNDVATDTALFDFRHDIELVSIEAPVEYEIGAPNLYVHHDDGTTVSNIGYGSPSGFYWAVDITDQMPAVGSVLRTIEFVVGPADGQTVPQSGEVYIWNADTNAVIYSQAWTDFGLEFEWAEVELTTPYVVDGTPLMIGVHVNDNPEGLDQWPAGAGPGPMVASYYSGDGVAWNLLSASGLDYNWNIWAGFESPDPWFIGFSETPVALTIANVGVYDEDANVEVQIVDTADSSIVYDDSAVVAVGAGESAAVDLAAWTPGVAGTYQMFLEASCALDEDLINGLATLIFVVDGEAPVTTATLAPASPNGDNGFYTVDVSILLEATDDNAVGDVFYILDGGDAITYTGGLIVVSADGDHEVEYWAVDAAGNIEASKTVSFTIDQTEPTISLEYEVIDDGGLFGDPVIAITATASDANGIDRVEFSDGTVDSSAPYETEVNAAVTITATAFDEAGNSASASVTPESYTNA